MDFLCFSVNKNNYAIQIELLYKIIDKYKLTHFPNEEQKPIFLISDFEKIIPIYEINNEYNFSNRKILILNTEKMFGIFIDDVKEIVRHEIPSGYSLISPSDIELMLQGVQQDNGSIELF